MLNHVKKIYLPYTVIDVGWWYQIAMPKVPSGRADYALMSEFGIVGDGSKPLALTDLRDIGRYVAKIIVDPRTLNKSVFAYSELLTQQQVYDVVERVSGEKLDRTKSVCLCSRTSPRTLTACSGPPSFPQTCDID